MMNFDTTHPQTIPEAIDLLSRGLHEKDKAHLVAYGVAGAHHALGRNVRNGWDLWDPKAPIVVWAKNRYGVDHGDDISGLILGGLHAQLCGEPFDFDEEAAKYRKHWADMAAMGDGHVVSLNTPSVDGARVPPPPSQRTGLFAILSRKFRQFRGPAHVG